MCGIAGFVGAGDPDVLHRMTEALVHRGPDEHGYEVDPSRGVYLGHRRLVIRDAEGGRQPMWDAEGSVCVVYNGEIYNHLELRAELEAAGHVFRSDHADTEVLVHGYKAWGEDLPRRLNGMFAFAVWDRVRRRLFLARDRFGEKPLYYAGGRDFFGFASEADSLLAHPACAGRLDQKSLQKFFAYGYVPAPRTIYAGIGKLEAGTALTLDLSTLEPRCRRYWEFSVEPDPDLGARSLDSLAEELSPLLQQSVERRLVSDVPIGFFLSGGIDSSAAVAAAAQRRHPRSLHTFSIGFEESSFDESVFADEVSRHVGTTHHLETLSIDRARAMLDPVLSAMDEPLGDPSILPTYQLSAATRRHVTVALTGDGGDELFAGYDPFLAVKPGQAFRRLVPPSMTRLLRRAAGLMPVSHRNISLDFKIKRSLDGLAYPQGMWNPVWMSLATPRQIGELFDNPLTPEELYEEALAAWDASAGKSIVDRTLEFYTKFYLSDDILMKVDRASMMNSLETRAVFLDNDLVEFARRLPASAKLRRGQRKLVLKRAMRRLLPDHIIERKKKGFGVPVGHWFANGQVDLPMETVPGMRDDVVRAYERDHRHGRQDHRMALWGWLAVQHAQRARTDDGAAGARRRDRLHSSADSR